MTMDTALEQRMADLSARQVPFVKATVVRAVHPTSAHPGDMALVLEDGRIEGFVGGVCAESTVRLQALRLLHSGESLLLRISPDAPAPPEGPDPLTTAVDGALVVANPCLSGGELEIFLEPQRPAPVVLVLGDTPIGHSLLALAAGSGYDLRPTVSAEIAPDALDGVAALVVASHGRDEEQALTAAARAGVPYVALVASRRRGTAVLAALDLDDVARARIHTPAGLWIGARTPGEIAVSILAELVAQRHAVTVHGEAADPASAPDGRASGASQEPRTETDPVCGMAVAVLPDTLFSDAGGGRRHWFCSAGCLKRFEADAERSDAERSGAEQSGAEQSGAGAGSSSTAQPAETP
ncbi:XdhC family protein [Streptacidiphilus anmyonensis]|uniref:XdhC family protein n=1 Tax=Streptacidiphilus anmyonensis TaxID=405782 RepID=UPI0007C6C219|nr:XdhC family protein [Streptacidiphilus anmyonensis]